MLGDEQKEKAVTLVML